MTKQESSRLLSLVANRSRSHPPGSGQGSWVFENAGALRPLGKLEGGATLAEQLVAYRAFRARFRAGTLLRHAYNHVCRRVGTGTRNAWIADMAQFFGWDHRGRRLQAASPERRSSVAGSDRPEEGNNGPVSAGWLVPSTVFPPWFFRYAMDRWGGEYPWRRTGA